MSEENGTTPEATEPVVHAPATPPAVESVGIKETMEVLDALDLIGKTVVKALEDGKITTGDLVHLADLARNLDKLMTGIKGADDAIKELKDLDQAELLTVVVRVFGIVKGIAKAKTQRGL